MRLFFTNSDIDLYNYNTLQDIYSPVKKISAEYLIRGSDTKKVLSDTTDSFHIEIQLVISARVILVKNL
jgi:hypothetical protein